MLYQLSYFRDNGCKYRGYFNTDQTSLLFFSQHFYSIKDINQL